MSDIEDAERIDAAPEPTDLYGCPRDESRGQLVDPRHRARGTSTPSRRSPTTATRCASTSPPVDYLAFPGRTLPPGVAAERFEVVVNFLDIAAGRRIRVRVQVPADDPTLPTLFDIHPGTEAMEREAFDMFGITFTDHPDLSRILMPEDWEGHPLRKDYEVGSIPVQFKEANS